MLYKETHEKPKTSLFAWYGIEENGMRVQSESRAPNQESLEKKLIDKNITLLSCKRKIKGSILNQSNKVKAKHVYFFTQQLSDLLSAGIDLSQSLEIIENSSSHKGIKSLSKKIKHSLRAGKSFFQSLKVFPYYFDSIYLNLVDAGEQSGSLDIMLKQLALYQEKSFQLKAKIKKALFYPMTVLTTMLGVSSALLFFVIPQFQEVFNSFGAKLPALTQAIINTANAMHSRVAGLTLLSFIALGYYYSKPKNRLNLAKRTDGILLTIPGLKRLVIDTLIIRWAHVLTTLLSAGLPITEALSIAHNTLTHHAMKKRMLPVLDLVKAGQTLHESLAVVEAFPSDYLQMISVGENTGELASMLGKINLRQQAQLDYQLDHLSQWLEPVMMIVLAALVGGLIIAMYLPIFQMGSII